MQPFDCYHGHKLQPGATRGVTVSMSAFLACHQCYCTGSSLAWGLNLRTVVGYVAFSEARRQGFSSGTPVSSPPSSFIGLMVQPVK